MLGPTLLTECVPRSECLLSALKILLRVDGAGRVTLRNRRFLRKYNPVRPTLPPKRTALEDMLVPQLPTTLTPGPPHVLHYHRITPILHPASLGSHGPRHR